MKRVLTAAAAAWVLVLAATPAYAVHPRASLPDVEDEVMCVVCGVPLNLADSPQADRERAYIRSLIARGDTKVQIKDRLVAQFGSSVLAQPPKHGFDAAAWLVPLAAVALALAVVALALVRWRRRSGPDTPVPAASPPIAPADSRRLDEDLARYDT